MILPFTSWGAGSAPECELNISNAWSPTSME